MISGGFRLDYAYFRNVNVTHIFSHSPCFDIYIDKPRTELEYLFIDHQSGEETIA